MYRCVLTCLVLVGAAVIAKADTMPQLPDTAVKIATATSVPKWAAGLPVASELYIDRVGGQSQFWEVYYLRTRTYPVRLTWRESYGIELVVWTAPGFE
jgi:hypothetical protein